MRKSSLIKAAIISVLLVGHSYAVERDRAWTALHNLDIKTARPLFEAQVKKSPKDLTALRGLMLAAAFDLDHSAQAKAIGAMVAADPGSPSLVAVFEHLAVELDAHQSQLSLQRKLAEGLWNNAAGPARYCGGAMLESYFLQTFQDSPPDFRQHTGYATGAWIIAPFDNKSNIAAYRPVALEHEPLDTLARIAGKGGYRASWTWVPSDQFGNLHPANAFGTETESACQGRSFFVLPQPNTVLILLGGAFCGRLMVDGAVVSDDPIYRNSYLRGGVKVALPAGPHEITIVIGSEFQSLPYSVGVTDTTYHAVPGLQWVRFADVPRVTTLAAQKVHPVFDAHDAWAAANAGLPDLAYWTAVTRTYNGYAPEIIREFETKLQEGKLSLLETHLLYETLKINGETERATAVLATIKEKADNPRLAYEWLNGTVTNRESFIRAFDSLATVYPNCFPIDALAAMKPLLNRDLPGMTELYKQLVEKYPEECTPHLLLSQLYGSNIQDNDAAYREMIAFCRQCEKTRQEHIQAPALLAKLGRHDEAISLLRQLLTSGSSINDELNELATLAAEVNRLAELRPLLDSLITQFPNNVYLYALLSTVHKRSGDLELGQRQLGRVHELKPAAILPWQSLDSLHHNVPYDSLFGRVDVMSLWDVTPTPAELAGSNVWKLINRIRKIVFTGGVSVEDFHQAWVLLNQEAVSEFQSLNLGFTPGQNFHTLLAARRLRQGQPPLEAERQNDEVIFKDLKPGDAVELHFRYWAGREGDLWGDWWDTYEPLRESYQRYWEYTVITDRTDVQYLAIPPATAPVETSKHGFRILTWSGQKTAGINLDGALLPPNEELAGTIYTTTLKSWEPIRKWYSSVCEAVLADNPRTAQLARDLIKGKTTEREKLEALYRYVVLEIPYQAIGFDYDGSIPRQPDQVLLNQWGDCKDKAHLLVSMLRTAGIPAWPTLVLTRDGGSRMPVPQFAFDHEIVGCLIGGDTIHIDPSDLTASPFHTVGYAIAGQPCLPVTPTPTSGLAVLPIMRDDQYFIQTVFSAAVADTGASRFICERTCRNTSAGTRRDALRGKSLSDLKTEIADGYSSSWNTPMEVDSISLDSTQTVDSVFSETWHGSMRLNVNVIGRTSLITLPDWSSFESSLPSNLLLDHARAHPVILDPYCGTYVKALKLTVPESFGEPQLANPVTIDDSLYTFTATTSWDAKARLLTVDYKLIVRQGRCDRVKFADFAKAVIKTFKTPILCQQS